MEKYSSHQIDIKQLERFLGDAIEEANTEVDSDSQSNDIAPELATERAYEMQLVAEIVDISEKLQVARQRVRGD